MAAWKDMVEKLPKDFWKVYEIKDEGLKCLNYL